MADYRQVAAAQSVRGIRNNNPGNLDDSEPWAYKVGSDGKFSIFDDSVHGLRALAKDLTTKINSDGLTTITAIVSQYAPATDNNDVGAYIQSVSDDSGIDPNAQLVADAPTLALLLRAITNHENGETASYQFISDQDISDGISEINLSAGQVFPQGSHTHKQTHL